MSLLLCLITDTRILQDSLGYPTFTPSLSLHATPSDPGDEHAYCRLLLACLLLSDIPTSSAITQYP